VLEAALVAWLVAALGDRALRGLRVITVGKPERTSLATALQVACRSLLDQAPPDAREALAVALAESFRKPPVAVLDGRTTVKNALVEGVLAQISPLSERAGTSSGKSRLQELGVDEAFIRAELPNIVIRSIQQVGPSHAALLPLASQLNADLIQDKIDEVLDAVQALALQQHSASAAQPPAGAGPAGRATRVDLLAPVLKAILEVPSMGDYSARMAILTSLSPRIRDAIPRSAIARVEMMNTIRTCQNYAGGMQELVAAIRMIEGDSEPIRNLDDAILALADNELVSAHLKEESSR
jgi:hypothetical protein